MTPSDDKNHNSLADRISDLCKKELYFEKNINIDHLVRLYLTISPTGMLVIISMFIGKLYDHLKSKLYSYLLV